jgi:hypothetical protein
MSLITEWWSICKYDESSDFVARLRADVWRRPGGDGHSVIVVRTSLALGLQGRRKADRGPDWHTDRARTEFVDRVRKNYVRPAINFEIRLPTADWNGKFYMAGCGGFCGTLDSDRVGFTNAMNYGLRRNYVVSTTDFGHWGTSVLDGRLGLQQSPRGD